MRRKSAPDENPSRQNIACISFSTFCKHIRVNSSAVRGLFLRAITLLIVFAIFACFWPLEDRFGFFKVAVGILLAGLSFRLMEILYPDRFNSVKIHQRLLVSYEKLERHQKLYCSVFLFAMFLVYIYALSRSDFFPKFSLVFICYCFGVAVYDILRIYRTLSETILGKGFVAILFAIGSNLAFCLAGIIVADVTHVSPTTFPHTLSLLAILSIPVLFVLAGSVLLPGMILIAPLLLFFSELQTRLPFLVRLLFAKKVDTPVRHYVYLTLLFQVILYVFLLTLIPQIALSASSRYQHNLKSSVAGMIYYLDMYPGIECRVDGVYRISSLGDENYILARKNAFEIQFEPPRKCQPK